MFAKAYSIRLNTAVVSLCSRSNVLSGAWMLKCRFHSKVFSSDLKPVAKVVWKPACCGRCITYKSGPKPKYNIVIFDKDGTITHCNKIFGPFLEELVLRLQHDHDFYGGHQSTDANISIEKPRDVIRKQTGIKTGALKTNLKSSLRTSLSFHPASLLQVSPYENHGLYASYFRENVIFHELFNQCEYDFESRKFGKNSVMTRGTTEDVIKLLIQYELGLRQQKSQDQTSKQGDEYDTLFSLVKDTYNSCETRIDASTIEPCISLESIQNLFKHLQMNEVKIGVCTQDLREVTKKTLDTLDISKYISAMACGDDSDLVHQPKPAPNGILRICRDVRETIVESIGIARSSVMVGDSLGDVEAGVRAGCGKVIFVLSSGFTEKELWHQWEKRVDESPILKRFLWKPHNDHQGAVEPALESSETDVGEKECTQKYACSNWTEIVVVSDISFVRTEIGL